jgi:UDP-GlcNAc:undecaprenyl-phosphate GlcNAc-1-phosphate transferase
MLTDRMPVPAWVAWPLTFAFLLGGTNAFNLADGLDGLAGGMAMLCLCGTALLAFTVGNGPVGAAAIIMVGALVGFLRFNTHPARVFMGDGGSQVLGLFVAVLAIMLTQDRLIPFSTALPLLLLGVPIIDTLMVMTERLLHGRSPFKADRGHIHHRLLALGFQHWEAVSILYLAQACFLVAAWYLRYASDLTVSLVFGLFVLLIIAPIRLAQHFGLMFRAAADAGQDVNGRLSEARRGRARTLAGIVLAVALAVQALSVLLYGAQPSQDVRLLALVLGALLTASLLLRRQRAAASWLEKAALYSCAALAIFLGKMVVHQTHYPPWLEYVLFPVLALAVAVWMRTTRDRAFRLTPLDILVLVIAVTIPNLPGSIASAHSLGLAVAELVLLFYALEALSFAAGRHWRWLSAAAAAFLYAVVLRALVHGP